MRFNDLQWVSSPEFYFTVVTADRVFRLFGRMLPPLAISGAIASGVWLVFFDAPHSVISHSTMRGFHLIFGLVILGDGVARLIRLAWAGLGLEPAWNAWKGAFLASLAGPVKLLDWAYWGLLLLMACSGLARVAMERYGVSETLISPAVGWGVIHTLMAKYFLSVAILRVFVHGTATASWLLAYLKRP